MLTPYDRERIKPENCKRYAMMYLKAKKYNPDLTKTEFCEFKRISITSLIKWLKTIDYEK